MASVPSQDDEQTECREYRGRHYHVTSRPCPEAYDRERVVDVFAYLMRRRMARLAAEQRAESEADS